jgi:hypothetical protein
MRRETREGNREGGGGPHRAGDGELREGELQRGQSLVCPLSEREGFYHSESSGEEWRLGWDLTKGQSGHC